MSIDGAPARPGLQARLQRLAATALQLAQVRVEILATDVELGALRLLDAIVLALAALLALAVGLGLLCGVILLIVQPEYRLHALAALALLFLGGGVLALRAARARLTQAGGLFQGTRDELARDVAAVAADRPAGP
jgi:uncharacterized membrane protein YqjE